MKNVAFSILHISSLFILYLSSQSGLYSCKNTGKTASKGNHSNPNSAVNSNSLSTEWSEKGYNFMDLVKNGYLKNKGDLDEVKDYLADELAGKIKDKLNGILKDENIFYDLENMDEEDISDFKNYLKDMSEYIGLKAADILNSNLEDSLKSFLPKGSFANLKEAMGSSSPVNLNFDDEDGETKKGKSKKGKYKKGYSNDENANDENANDEDVDETTEDFINELVDAYEEKHHKDLENYAQEIKNHNNLD
ncbi:male development gene 1, putative [Plasmodium knowlesi strain H]|uniref:Male development gene 1, putative n=3 Tax=Plasmodium knowlesi TaxID=5850 RepID=A0A5K1UHR2_PLAKH|nr:male development gene 1, putative [Plasmodium knowlesi strain H]OTN64272.1 putative Male development protein 1 [Plasmodium knowlesi]CAA9990958.1 male development gene 1, putative [Plasmodium knowlesi strain H]SBO20815.1 male development gene 1, putative [Plasmodium knowlesi strain H]SBO21241.1 male development gene 1, putative [Plasmodium knowlesi strain H]VVS80432.1 male development gene 1, putative [Plasmodium knowlesi strain H]|eukprot:XP_002262241.1 hypothetical protein, conserved in Plasmodium species [Plasmodium knowlesi strain H]